MSEDHAAVTGRPRHIVLNSHPTGDQSPIAMHWGAADAAARVTGSDAESVELTLVNLSPSRTRQVVIGAGTFGEHRFDRIRAGDEILTVDGTYFLVDLEPATQIELALGMQYHSQRPTFREPWHGDGIPYR